MVEAAIADLAACTDGELVEALAATERVRSAMAAHAATLTAACDHRQVWAGDGAASPAVWVAQQCDQPVADARRHLRHARRLEDMPETRAAFGAGEIGEAKAAMLAAARTDRLASEFDRCEPHLVASAKVLTCDQLAKVLTRWRLIARDAVDPDTAAAADGDDPQCRPSEVFLSQTLAGRYVLSGDLTAEDGAILAHGIETANRALFHRGARLSDGAELEPAQRRAVGLVETFKRGITADPDRSGAQPLVLATVDLGLLTRQAERQALRGRRRAPNTPDDGPRRAPHDDRPEWSSRRCVAANGRGTPAHRHTGRRARVPTLHTPRRTTATDLATGHRTRNHEPAHPAGRDACVTTTDTPPEGQRPRRSVRPRGSRARAGAGSDRSVRPGSAVRSPVPDRFRSTPHDASPATAASPASSSAPTARSSTTAERSGSPPASSARRWSSGIAAASSRAVTAHRAGARPTTSTSSRMTA